MMNIIHRTFTLNMAIILCLSKLNQKVHGEGKFPRRALSALLEWAGMHHDELLQDWELACQHCNLNKIEPLE